MNLEIWTIQDGKLKLSQPEGKEIPFWLKDAETAMLELSQLKGKGYPFDSVAFTVSPPICYVLLRTLTSLDGH